MHSFIHYFSYDAEFMARRDQQQQQQQQRKFKHGLSRSRDNFDLGEPFLKPISQHIAYVIPCLLYYYRIPQLVPSSGASHLVAAGDRTGTGQIL